MFDIGFVELLIVGIIALLVLGPERLPKAAHSAGKWVGKARRMVNQFTRELDRQVELEELKEQLKQQKEALDLDKEAKQIKDTVDAALEEAQSVTEATNKAFEELPNSIHDPSETREFEPLPRAQADAPPGGVAEANSQSDSNAASPNTRADKDVPSRPD